MLHPVTGRGHRENGVLHAFDGRQGTVEFLDLLDRAAHDDVFHAMVVVKVRVLRADDEVAEIMLGFDDFLRELRFVMVVNERNDPGDDGTLLPLPLHQSRADEMLDRLGTGRKTLLLGQVVEMFKDIFFNRNRNARDF